METRKRKIRVWGLVILALTGLGCSLETKNIQAAADTPTQVKNHQKFDIKIRITNTANGPQTLVGLDMADSFLKGIVIKATNPAFKQVEHLPVVNQMSYDFQAVIPANGSVTVTLQAEAVHPGDYSGTVDVDINSISSSLTEPLRTVVE